MIFLLAMCGQNIKKASDDSIKAGLTSTKQIGLIKRRFPDVNYVPLLDAPKANGNEIGELQEGTHVILKEYSEDGKWIKILTKEDKIGWVLHVYVENITKK
jgi:hypothetical protein